MYAISKTALIDLGVLYYQDHADMQSFLDYNLYLNYNTLDKVGMHIIKFGLNHMTLTIF